MKKIGILLLALFIYPLHLSFAESRLIWSFPSGTVESSPAMDQNGNIYFSNDDDRNLYALNPDGSLKWNIGVFGGGIFRDTPVIGADGSIYIKNGDAGSSGMLTAIDQNGQIKWQFHAPNSLGLAIGNDGTIYNSQYSQLSAINPDGSLKWELFEEHALWWQPVVNSTGKIITGYYDHDENSELMVSLDPDTGKVIWKKSVSIVANAIAIGNLNQIYVVSTDGGLYAFDENGSDLWVNTDVSFSTKGLAIADDGTIYADGRALTSSGTVKWTGDWWGIPAIGKDGVVYVSGRDGLNALNPDGSLAWKYTGIGNSNPIIGNNGILYAGSSSGGIIAIRTDSGGYCESSWPMQSGGYAHSARSYDYNKIHAGFLTSRSMGISPLPVQFTNYASGNPTTYLWDFGDGTSSDQLNPEHIYMNPGLYSVSLTVSGSDHQDTHTKQHCIWVHQENEFTYPSNPHISVSNTSGNDLSVARKSDGTVWRWSSGFAPAIIEGISDVAGLSAGHDQIFLIKQDKSVWGLGQNHCDLFGGVNVTTPVLLPGSSPVLDATAEGGAGEYPHNLNGTLLKDDNTAWQWDCINKEWYQWPEFTDILAVHTRYMFSDDFYEKFYQKKDGSFWKLDTNPNMVGRFATVIEPIKRFSAGPFHCLALNADGTIWAWGQNAYGQLGDGAQNDASDGNPTKVNGLTNVIAISAGGHHSLALKSDGTVWAWGSNGGGQIGDGTNQDRFEPVRVIDLPKAIAIAAGMDFSAAVTEDGNVWTWGYVSSVSPFFRYQPEKIGLNLISDNKPRLEVSPDHNWINGNDFPYDTPLVLTIDPVNSGNNLTANLTSDSSGNFNKNVYDFTDPSDPSISYKLQPGDVVTAVCGTHTVTVTVPDVTHAVDLETGAISGTASGFQTVLIVVYQLDGMVLCDTQVTIDPDGSFSTQCNGLEPGMGIDLILTDVDGNTLVYHGYNPIPTLQAMITHNWISGEGFPKDTSGAITINPGTDKATVINGKTDNQGTFWVNVDDWQDQNIATGDVIDAVCGNVQATMTVQNLQAIADADGDKIAGSAQTPTGQILANRRVDVSISPEWGENAIHSQDTVTDQDGNFVLNLAPFDLQIGQKIFMTLRDNPNGNNQGHRTSMSPFNDPKTIQSSVTNNNYPDGHFETAYDLYVWRDPNIVIDEIFIDGPNGRLPYTKDDFQGWSGAPYYRYLFVDGAPAIGTYTFHVVSNGLDVMTQDVQAVNRTMPIPEFITPNNGEILTTTTPTIEWTEVTHPDTTIYYRLVIDDINGNRVYSSPRMPDMLSVNVPEGNLHVGQSYRLQIRTSDSDNWIAMQNQGRNDCTITIATSSKGDLNNDGVIDLFDGILALQILAGYPVENVSLDADVNGDGRIGMPEAIYVLQVLGGVN